MIRFAGWWERKVFSFLIEDSLIAVVKTKGGESGDVTPLDRDFQGGSSVIHLWIRMYVSW